MLVSTSQMKASEEAALIRGIKVEALMEMVGESIAKIVTQFYPYPGRLIVFGGKGKNAGDVLVAARFLVKQGWHVQFRCAFPETTLSALVLHKLMEFRQISLNQDHIFPSSGPLVVLDGLLGIGANGPPRTEICVAIEQIHSLRREGAWVLSADIPTGLDVDSGLPNISCVKADLTASIGFVKQGLIADAATDYVGRLALITLTELLPETNVDDPTELITPRLLIPWLPARKFDSHKGLYGRVGILAGSRCYPGAARLCTYAALRAGAGSVMLFVQEELEIYSLIAASLPPEAIICPIRFFKEIFQQRLDVLCVGPGMKEKDGIEEGLLEVVREAKMPVVIDAGMLNIIADRPQVLHECCGLRLLTPHPGEFARLAPKLAKLPRRKAAEAFVANYPDVTLLLKGARAIITEIDRPSLINSTGNPGMSSGGMGDAMTGVCGALLAQGLSPRQAAGMAAWLCGRAAEIAIFFHGQSPQSLLAGDVIQLLGQAFCSLYRGTY